MGAVEKVVNEADETGSADYMAAEPIKINKAPIDLQGGEATDEQVKNVIMNFAEANPSFFKGGLADVRIMMGNYRGFYRGITHLSKGEALGFMATERIFLSKQRTQRELLQGLWQSL